MDNKWTENNQNGHESESEAHDVNLKSAEVDTSVELNAPLELDAPVEVDAPAEVSAPVEVDAPAASRIAQAAERGEPVGNREQLIGAERNTSKEATDDRPEDEAGDEDQSEEEDGSDEEDEPSPDPESKPAENAEPRPDDGQTKPEEEKTKPVEGEETKPGEDGESKPSEAGTAVDSPQVELFPAELAPRAEVGAIPPVKVTVPVEYAGATDLPPAEPRDPAAVAAHVNSFFHDMCAYYRGVLAGLVIDDAIIKRVSGHFDDVYEDWYERVFGGDSDTPSADRASHVHQNPVTIQASA